MSTNAQVEYVAVEGNGGDTENAIRTVANSLHRLNEAVRQAVSAGVTVELMRASRVHANGSWGDQMVPIIKQ